MTVDEFLANHNFTLTSQQREAVLRTEGPLLLLAVPGSGKTTVLVVRLGYMIYGRGIDPRNILVLTYTVAATRDMSERFVKYFGDEHAGNIEFRTINGLCARIILYASRLFGQAPLELMDEKETAPILSQIVREITETFPTESDIRNVKLQITYIKNMILDREGIRKLEAKSDYPISKIYEAYNRKLRELNRMDYDDQMIYALNLLKRFPEILDYYRNIYRYIMVDEAQDTSKIQHEIIKLLAAPTDNLFMVGDEDQSIYGFRAAYPDAVLKFALEHKNAQVLLMEQNFRSTGNIVRCASKFINRNVSRHPKNMITRNPEGQAIYDINIKSRRAQYSYLLKVAKETQGETAILYRDNESALPLIDAFERNGIPYRLVGASRDFMFFTNKIVLDVVNIIRFAYDPYNAELFLQIYYKIGTYLKKEDAMAIVREAEERNIPIMDAAVSHAGLPANVYGALKGIRTNLGELKSDKGDKAIFRIMSVMGYAAYLERNKINDSKSYILESLGAGEPSALRLLYRLEELENTIKNRENDYKANIVMSTIHSSKGLEYDTVYLIDAVDGLFPEEHHDVERLKYLDPETLKEYEEERRLFYVAITRARANLNLFSMPNSSFCKEALGKEVPVPSAEKKYKSKSTKASFDIYKDTRKRNNNR